MTLEETSPLWRPLARAAARWVCDQQLVLSKVTAESGYDIEAEFEKHCKEQHPILYERVAARDELAFGSVLVWLETHQRGDCGRAACMYCDLLRGGQ